MNQTVLNKMDILKVKELKKELVPVPEWNGSVWVQEMDAEARDRFDNWVLQPDNDKKIGGRARIVIATVIDEEGKLLFTDLDIPDLLKKSSKAITALSDVGMRLSGMSEEAKDDKTKNSDAAPNVDSSSSSVEN